MADNGQEILLRELLKYFAPVLDTQGDVQQVFAYLDSMGWKLSNLLAPGDQQNVAQAIGTIVTQAQGLVTLAETPPPELEDLVVALSENVTPIVVSIGNLVQAFPTIAQ